MPASLSDAKDQISDKLPSMPSMPSLSDAKDKVADKLPSMPSLSDAKDKITDKLPAMPSLSDAKDKITEKLPSMPNSLSDAKDNETSFMKPENRPNDANDSLSGTVESAMVKNCRDEPRVEGTKAQLEHLEAHRTKWRRGGDNMSSGAQEQSMNLSQNKDQE